MQGSIKQGLFLRIERFATRNYRTVFLITLLAVALSILLGSRLTLNGDVLALLPKNNTTINSFRDALKDFGGLDYLLVVIEAKQGQGAEDLQEFADLLATRLQKIPEIRFVEDLYTAFYGARQFTVRDPDGYDLAFHRPAPQAA